MVCPERGGEVLPVGRRFRVTNPDSYVERETLTVEAFADPDVRLRSERTHVVDIAGVDYGAEYELVGVVEAWTPQGVEVRLVSAPIVEARVVLSSDGRAFYVIG